MPVYRTKDGAGRTRFRYEFDRFIDGRRQRTTKLLPVSWSRSQAEEYAKKQDGALYLVATGSVKPRRLISEAVESYLRERGAYLKNRAVLERELVNCFDAYEGRFIDELSEVCREYVGSGSGLRAATVRNRLAYLRAACRYAWKHCGMGEHDPAERVSLPPVNNARHTYLTRKEVLQVARRMDLWPRAIVLVGFYSGMRLGEILKAKVTEQGWLLEDTKNGSRRIVPVHPKVAYLARQWPAQVAPSTVQHAFKRAVRSLGYEDVRFHDLRHSAASAMANAGVDQFTVGAVLGHKAGASTKRYSHLYVGTLENAVRRIL